MKKHLFTSVFILISYVVLSQDKFKNPIRSKSNQTVKTDHFSVVSAQPQNADLLKITRDETGLPIFISGKIKNPVTTKHARGTAASLAFGYLETLKETLKINAPQNEFKINTTETDELNQQHIRLDQYYRGLKVYGGEMVVHSNNGEVDLLNGRYFPTPKLRDLNAFVNQEKALDLVKNDLGKVSIFKDMTALEKSIMKYNDPSAELIIFHENDDINLEKLAWKIDIRPNLIERWQYFVDAKTGAVLSKINHTCSLDGPATATATDLNGVSRSIKSYQTGGGYVLIDTSKDMFLGGTVNSEDPQGVIWTIDASNTTPEDLSVKQVSSSNNAWSNRTAVSAHTNAGIAYDYYKKAHGRVSLNGKGGSIISIINITETNETTGKVQQMDNAFWNGEFMGYGNGNTFFKPLAGGLDVAGHEMTHGVIENTANLNYQGQSGAINESMADVFGVLIDRQDGDFVVGEDVMKSGPFLRSLSDPTQGKKSLAEQGFQPASMSQIYAGTEDNGGVHINSGIPNRAFYLFVKALTGSEEQQKAKAEKVYYRALTKYLTRSSKFIDLRAAIVQSCKDLASEIGADAETAANTAFSAVGIGGTSTSTPAPTQKPVEDLPTNSGSEFIISYDPCEKAIYNSNIAFTTNIVLVSNVIIDHKPSVTDDGSFAYYISKKAIGEGGTLNRVNLAGTPKPEVLSSDEVWNNVAVSKDGKKLALNTIETSANDQQRIFIYDITTGSFYKSPKDGKEGFPLYNPTYSNNLKSAGIPLFSDALEWEYDGENVIYDAKNRINSNGLVEVTNNTSLDYWDVGELKAWDVNKNTFGDGTIGKIFTNLAKGESIGNPTLAKKSTSVVAFDHVFNAKNYVLTVDFENKSNDGGYKRSEFLNNTIAYPEFSAKDDKLIFNRLVTSQSTKCDTSNTASINLVSDKVTTSGTINNAFIGESSLAVWYTVGKRELPTTTSTQIITFPAPGTYIEGNTSNLDLQPTTDKGTTIVYKVISGPASIVNGKVVTTGRPGKVKIQANANATSSVTAAESTFEFCVNPTKPTIKVTELANAILLQSSDDYTNEWFADGVSYAKNIKGIEITNSKSYTVVSNVDGCLSEASAAYKAGASEAQSISTISVSDRLQGTTSSIDLPAKTDKGNNITYTVVSGPAVVVGNKLTPNGQPGRVIVKGVSPAGLKYAAAETTFEFCVNPSKPTISIVTQTDQYVFTSSATSGNNWYRNNVALNVTDRSINVVSTNSFTVQVVVDGCKSEFSNAAVAPKEIVLAEEELTKAGIIIFPNPMADVLNMKLSNIKIENITLSNLAGMSFITKENIKSDELKIDTKLLPRGIYVLKLITNKGVFNKKLLKE